MPKRPMPPEDMIEDTAIRFEPAPDLEEWARSTFIDDGAELLNEDHAHRRRAGLPADLRCSLCFDLLG